MENDPMSSSSTSGLPSASPKNEYKAMRLLVSIVVILLIAGVAYWLMKGSAEAPQDGSTKIEVAPGDQNTSIPVQPAVDQPITVTNPDGTPINPVVPPAESTSKIFNVSATNFVFVQNEIRVKKGDTVKINLLNNEGTHDIVIDEFSVKTPRIGEGQTAAIEFIADKVGTFEFYCSVGQHRAMGMKGTLIVE